MTLRRRRSSLEKAKQVWPPVRGQRVAMRSDVKRASVKHRKGQVGTVTAVGGKGWLKVTFGAGRANILEDLDAVLV